MNDTVDSIDARLASMKNEREKLAFLLEQCGALLRTDPVLGLDLAERALALAETLRDRRRTARSLELIAYYIRPTAPVADVISHVQRARALYRALRDNCAVAGVDQFLAAFKGSLGEHAEAIRIAERCVKLYEKVGDRNGIAKSLNTIGLAKKELGDLAAGLEAMQKAVIIWEELGATANLGRCYNNIGLIYRRILDHNRAEEYFLRSLELRCAVGDLQGEATTLNNLGGMYCKLRRTDEGLPYLLRANEIYRRLGQRDREIGSWNAIGGAHEMLGDYKTAMRCFRTGLAIAKEIGNHRLDAFLYSNFGRACYKLQHYHRSLKYLKRGLHLAIAGSHLDLECDIYETLAWVYSLVGDFSASYDYSFTYIQAREKLSGPAVQREVMEVRARMEMERITREQQAESLRAGELQQEIDRKNLALTAMTLQLMQRNELISKLKEHIRKIEGAEDLAATAAGLKAIRENMAMITDWETLAPRFHTANESFHAKLAKSYPVLTPAELKVCSLIRANLASKDIAALLYIAVRTVEIHRGRIRKKLNLPASRSLAAFFAAI